MRKLFKQQEILKHNVFLGGILFSCLVFLSYKFLSLWFNTDDTSCIYGSTQNWVKLLFDRDTYLLFNKMFFSPFLPISFKPDFMFFGLNPIGYHINNMLAAFLTGLMGYKVFRLYFLRLESWIGTFIFVLSYPFITNIGWITRKHYIWGTFFTLLSFYLFKKWEAKNRHLLFLLSSISYLVALLFKEAFAPLPGMIFILSSGHLKERVLKTTPYIVTFGLYFMLRFYMLGGLGGYIGVKAASDAVGLIKNSISQIDLFFFTLWGLKPLYTLPILFVLFALSKRTTLVVTALFFVAVSPFILLKMPATVDNYYIFYFPSKFMLPMFIISSALVVLLKDSRTLRTRLLIFSTILILFVLQIDHAPDAYAFLKQSSESYKRLTSEALNKNLGSDILVVHDDAIFYNYLYETALNSSKSPNIKWGIAFTFNDPDIMWLFKNEYFDKIKHFYLKNKWVDKNEIFSVNGLSINNTIPEPRIRLSLKGHFLTLTITDEREGIFYGVLKSVFSNKNIAFQSMLLPKDITIKIGLTGGKESVYLFYCEDNQCSKPVVLKPEGGTV